MLQVENNNQYHKDTLYEVVCQVKEMLDTDRPIEDIRKYLKSITCKETYGISEIYALAYCYDFMESILKGIQMNKIYLNSANKKLEYQDNCCIRQISYPVSVIAKSLLTNEQIAMVLESEADAQDLMVDEFDLYIKQ